MTLPTPITQGYNTTCLGLTFSCFILITLLISSCSQHPKNSHTTEELQSVVQVHDDYVEGWRAMDEAKIMGLLDENARLQPSGLNPIDGIAEIKNFWFPDDGSTTTINNFQTEMISVEIRDSIAISTHHSILDWDYEKDSLRFGMVQQGINTTVYKRRGDKSWKIWRSMWVDLSAETK